MPNRTLRANIHARTALDALVHVLGRGLLLDNLKNSRWTNLHALAAAVAFFPVYLNPYHDIAL
jgi:hypothetical protein